MNQSSIPFMEEIRSAISSWKDAGMVVATTSSYNSPVWLVHGELQLTVGKLSQVVTLITAAISYIVFLLWKINLSAGKW